MSPVPDPIRSRRAIAGPLIAVAAVAVVANIVYLAGVTDPNPVNYYSGLTATIGARYLPGIDYVDPNIGFTAQALGHLAATDWLHGRIPWWNPYEGIGAPLAGEMQAAAFFPLVLLDVFSTGQVLFRLILEIVAGAATFLLLRRLVASPWVAAAGGAAFAMNGTFAWMFHAPGNPIAFAPMLVLGVEQALEGGRRLAGVAVMAAAVALGLYAGFPEVAYIDAVLAAGWFLLRATTLRRRALAAFAGRVVAGGALGLLLAAPILVAFVTYLPGADVGPHDGALGATHLNRALALPDLVLPYVFGPITAFGHSDPTGATARFWSSVGGYLGASVAFLALVGLFGRSHRRLRIGLGAWVVLAVGRTVGEPVAARIVDAIPAMDNTSFYRYAGPSTALAVIVLAALAIDDLAVRRRIRLTVVLGVLSAGAVLLAGHRALQVVDRYRSAPESHLWAYTSIGWGLAMVTACVAAACLRGARWRAGLLCAVVVVEALALFVVPELSTPTRATIDTGPVRFLQTHMGTGRFFTLGPLGPDYGSYWQLGSVDVNDLPVPKTYVTYVHGQLNDNVDPLVFTGVHGTTSSGPDPAEEFMAHLGAYEAAGVVYLVARHGTVLPPPPPGVSLPVVYDDPLVTIRRLPHPQPLFSATGGGCRVELASLTAATVDCSRPGTLVYREQYLPGWTATDLGRSDHVAAYRSVFQTTALTPGRNVIRFSFAPPYADLAEVALLVGLVLLGAAVVVGRTGRSGGGLADGDSAVRWRHLKSRDRRAPRWSMTRGRMRSATTLITVSTRSRRPSITSAGLARATRR
jgi:hypothetical protein